MLAGGIFQILTGFGANMLLLMTLPAFMPLLQVSAVSSMISLCFTASVGFSLRKHVDWKAMLVPLPGVLAVSTFAIHVGPLIDKRLLGVIFGLFLLLLALWSLSSDRFRRKSALNWKVTAAVVVAAGFASGWFGLCGPLISLYFLAATHERKLAYIATMQVFFIMTGSFNTAARVAEGIITADLLPLTAIGIVGVLLGKNIGMRLLDRINVAFMKKLISAGLLVSGLSTVLKNLP